MREFLKRQLVVAGKPPYPMLTIEAILAMLRADPGRPPPPAPSAPFKPKI